MRGLFGMMEPFVLEETDPGKDLFALLFISFLLIGVVLWSGISASERRTPVHSNTSGGSIVVERRYLAELIPCDGGICLRQAGRHFRLPSEARKVAQEGFFPPGFKEPTLLILPPPSSLRARDLLVAVSALNEAGLRVEFRTPETER